MFTGKACKRFVITLFIACYSFLKILLQVPPGTIFNANTHCIKYTKILMQTYCGCVLHNHCIQDKK